MNDQELNLKYGDLVRQAADEWRAIYLNQAKYESDVADLDNRIRENIKKRLEGALLSGLEDYAIARLRNLGAEDAQKMADFMIDKWIKNYEIEINEPSDKVREQIKYALDGLQSRRYIFSDAVHQKRVKAFTLREAKVPLSQIARELGVSRATAKAWIDDEQETFGVLKETLSIYGYTAVKS